MATTHALPVPFHEFDPDSAPVQRAGEHRGRGVAAYDHGAADVYVALAEQGVEGIDGVPLADHEHQVSVLELGAEFRDYRLVLARDRDYPELLERLGVDRLDELGELEVEHRGIFVYLVYRDLQLAAGEFHGFRRGVVLEEIDDLVGRGPLGIEQQLDAHFLEQQLVLGRQVVLVAYACDHLAGAQPLCQQGSHYVYLLGREGVHGDEQVGVADIGFAQDAYRRRIAHHGLNVRVGAQGIDALLVVVYDRDVVGLALEHVREMGAYLSGTFNDDFHNSSNI